MKDSEFLELLNLYLDHEITPADAARLEAEVRADPDRRRTYLQYCRMQKACAILAADFAAERPVAPRASTRERIGWAAAGFASFGVVAAGLAVAFIFWQRAPGPAVGTGPALAVTSSAVQEPKRGLVAAADRVDAPRLTLVGEPLVLSASRQVNGPGSAASTRPAEDQLEWLRNFQVATVPVADAGITLEFNQSAAPRRPEARQLGLKAQAEAAEMTAFRYAK